MNNQETVQVVENNEEVIVTNDTPNTSKKGFMSKVKNVGKKHGKKALAVALIGVAGVVGYALGQRVDEDAELDVIDVDYTEVEEIEDVSSDYAEESNTEEM